MGVRRESKRESYDLVVVGSGLGGLTAAALCAKAGRSVLVVERHDRPGGYAHSFQLGPCTFDAAVHLVGGCEGGLIDRLLRSLGIRDLCTFVRAEPFYSVRYPGRSVDVPAGHEAFVEAHARQFPQERSGFAALVDLSRRVAEEAARFPTVPTAFDLLRTPTRLPTLFRYRNSTLQDVLEAHLKDPRARALFASLWPYLGLPPSKLSFVYWSAMLTSYLDGGAFYCRGSWQKLPLALVASIHRDQGEVLLSSPVRRILLKDGAAVGVQLETGQSIRAGTVVSNVDARQTFEQLVGEAHVPPRYLRRLRAMRPSLSAFVLFIATDLDLRALGACHQMFLAETWDPEQAYRDVQRGLPSGLGIDIPTLLDPSLAPPGQHLVIATSLIPYDIGSSWREEKARYTERLLDRLESIFPGFRAHTKRVEGASPRTMERYTLNLSGSIYGWEVSPDQVGPGRLGHRTPIPNLLLSGHWTQPGGGVYGVVVSGLQTAALILRREFDSRQIWGPGFQPDRLARTHAAVGAP